jgi:hypothetical protein
MARLFRSQKQIKGLNLPDEPMLKDYDQALIAERQKIERKNLNRNLLSQD